VILILISNQFWGDFDDFNWQAKSKLFYDTDAILKALRKMTCTL